MISIRTLSAFVVAVVLVVVVAACGGGVPGNSVAKVGDTTVKQTEFDHWLRVAALSQAPGTGGSAVVPDPPNFTQCVAQKRKAQPKPAKGQTVPTDAQLKTQCQQEYGALRDQVMQFLISAQWILGEAKSKGIKVTDAEVQKQFEDTRKASFPNQADYDRFLKQSGMNQQDILFRVRLDALSTKLRNKITQGKDQVTPAEIQAYYDKNRQQFGQPERRDLRLILTKDKAKADEAIAAIKGGEDFGAVAKRLSTDQQSKDQGGKLPGVTKGTQDQALDQAAFSAPKGKLVGPIKGQFGYYVFDVTKIDPPTQQSLQQATPTIRSALVAQNQQKALSSFVDQFRKKWRDKTECRKDFNQVQDCKNAPKQPKPGQTTTPSPGQGTTTAPGGQGGP